MLRHAKIKIGYCGRSFKKVFNKYKKPLASRVAFLNNKNVEYNVSNFDCDYTHKKDNCIISYISVEEIPFFLEICKNDKDYCIIVDEKIHRL